jgi:hypothetical protein
MRGCVLDIIMTSEDIQKLQTALLTYIPDIQVEIGRERVLFLSPKFFLEIKDNIVSMSVLTSPVIKFRHINIDRTIKFALEHL